jgi:uncharacterized membrane protein YbhN (UPF0104 family)
MVSPPAPIKSPDRGLPPPDDAERPRDWAAGEDRPVDVAPTTARPRSGLIRFAGPLVFLASLLAAAIVLWRQGSLDEVGTAVRGADPAALVVGLLLYLVGLSLLCLRWHVLVVMAKGVSDLPKAAEVFLISVALNYVAPLKLAIGARAAMTKRALRLDATETGAIVLWEGTIDVAVLASGTIVWLAVSHQAFGEVLEAVGGALPLYLGLLVVVALVTAAGWLALRRRPILRAKIMASVGRALRFPRQRPAEAGWAVAITVIYWSVQAGVLWILLDAVGAETSAGLALGLVTLPILFGMLSPGPGGAGVREALMVAVAGAYGGDAALALVAAVAYRILLAAAVPILYVLVKGWIALRGERDGGQSVSLVSNREE